MFRQFLLILLAGSIVVPVAPAHAQTSAKPEIVLPPLKTVQPLQVGPPRDPKDEIELSPTPVDQTVEHPLLIEITIFEHEPLPERERHSTDPSDSRIDTHSVRIATDGVLTGGGYWGYTFAGEFGGWRGGPPLSADSLAKVKSLIPALPPDHGRIPPRNHKVQVEIATHHGTEKRMYDAANLPEALLEIFRLTDALFTPLVPQFAPDSHASVPEPKTGRAETVMAVTHDRKLAVVFRERADLGADIDIGLAREIASGREQSGPGDDWAAWPQVVDASNRSVFEVPPLPNFSRRSTRFRAAWFTPDDHYLVFSTSIPAIRIYDTRTWQEVAHIPAIPPGAIDFEPSPDWKYAVAAFPSGEIDLWDVESRRRVSSIDLGGGLLRSVVWAPDNREVAVHAPGSYPSTSHLRIWDARTGRLEQEIRSVNQLNWWFEGAPLWSPNGRYLLMDGSGAIGVWNVETGRYRGSFTHAECQAQTQILRFDAGHLIMDCDGRSGPVVWDADSAIRTIASFEASLSAEK